MKINNVIKSLSASNAAIKNTASLEPKDGWYPTYSASGQDVWLPNYRFEQKGIVVSAVGARCGKAFKADGKWNVCANTHPLSVDETIADRDYCWYMLNNENWWIKGGTAQPFVKVKDSLNREHNFPSITVQKEIVAELDKISSIIDLRNAELQKLDELVKARFVEMFGDPVTNPMDWPTKPLLEMGYCKNGMNFHTGDSGIEMHCLGVGDFKDYSVIDGTDYLPTISLNEAPPEESMLQDGDLVFVRSNGNKALVGRCLLVYPHNTPTTYSGFCIRYRLTSAEVNIAYLLRVLKTDSMRKKMAGRGANIQNLNQQILAALNIPTPPLELQEWFTAFIEQIDKSKLQVPSGNALCIRYPIFIEMMFLRGV